MRTMWEALKICMPITLMTFAIFTRSNMVVTTGWAQIADVIVVFIGTSGVAFATFGRISRSAPVDIGLRLIIAALALFALFTPSDTWALAISPLIAILLIAGVVRHREIAPPALLPEYSDVSDASGDLSALVAEAKRDMG
jgi:TRAP-type uncharacterized transport system fused permease subunit